MFEQISIYDFIGTIGVLLVLIVYLLMQIDRIKSEQAIYSWLNLVGAALIWVSLFYEWNLPSAIMQTCWIIISGYGVWKAKKREKNNG